MYGALSSVSITTNKPHTPKVLQTGPIPQKYYKLEFPNLKVNKKILKTREICLSGPRSDEAGLKV